MRRLPGRSRGHANQIEGKFFEEAFEKMGRLQGFLVQKTELSARRTVRGFVAIKSDLDYKVCTRGGQVGFFDCKSFDGKRFGCARINPKQAERARLYNEYRVNAGFVVWFRELNEVCLFLASQLEKGKGLCPADCAAHLGTLENMRLSRLFLTSLPPQEGLRPPAGN